MRSSCVMFVAAICILLLVKLKWPKNKSVYDEKKTYYKRKSNVSNSVENGDFSHNSEGGTKEKSSKIADFLGKFRKAKIIGYQS